MNKARGQMKTMSNGTSTSPFPKSHRSTVKMGRNQGSLGTSKPTGVTKRPNIKGQK